MGWETYIYAWKLRFTLMRSKMDYIWSKRDCPDEEIPEVLDYAVESLKMNLVYLIKPALVVTGFIILITLVFSS